MARRNTEFPFAPNQKTIPDYIEDGVVYFTDVDGGNVWSDESMCKAYGYLWDEANQVCRAFIPQREIEIVPQSNISVKGANNEIRTGVNNSTISGQNNLMIGKNISVNIIGNRNQIENKISNSLLLGTLGNSLADNSITIGGNSGQNGIDEETGAFTSTDILGERQLTFCLYGGKTPPGEKIPLTTGLNLNNVSDSYYPIPENAVLMFEIDILGVAIEPAGNRGDFMTFKSNGVTMKKTSGEGGTPIQSRTSEVLNSGGLRWVAEPVIAIGTDGKKYLGINATGDTRSTIEWVADLKITQLQTNVNL
tara:strand:- start:1692 stop:2612 length:921 start_codon:yes stop_codon:yes gene_type:complete